MTLSFLPTPLRQMARGCTTLPHVGSHPGVPIAFLMVFMGAANGLAYRGIPGAIFFGLGTCAFIFPILLLGAHGRARLSDDKVRRQAAKSLLSNWVNAHCAPHNSIVRIGLRLVPNPDPGCPHVVAWHDNPSYDITFPDALLRRLDIILTGSFDGMPARRPGKPIDPKSITVRTKALSAHERLAAVAELPEDLQSRQ